MAGIDERARCNAQVEIVDLELVQRVVEGRVRLVVPHVPLRQHAHHKQLGARNPGVHDGLTDRLLVAVHPRGVQSAASVLEV